MPFISVSDEVAKKSFTSVENKFITKYLPVLEPVAVKVYLYSLYIYQNGMNSFTAADLAAALNMESDRLREIYEYLEEFELVSIVSALPLEVNILDAENVYGTPKKFKPEKYADFTKNVQNTIKGRMISTNEFREYFYLLEEYGFEQNALIMIINYCVNLKGDDIRLSYIKKVAKSFADEGVTTAKKVDEKLSAYTSSTPALIKIFNVAGIKRRPDIEDDKLYKKWTSELGFENVSIIAAAKLFKAKNVLKLDSVLEELYKTHKFDVKEIEDYAENKNSVYALTYEIAKCLGVYVQNAAPYVENYVNKWCNYGYSPKSIKLLANQSFKSGKNSFEDMSALVSSLYDEGIVDDSSVENYLNNIAAEDKILKEILSRCGLSRKLIDWDRQALKRWRAWNFSDEMLLEASSLSYGKSNPLAYMNAILSSWKSENIFSKDKIPVAGPSASPMSGDRRAEIERHYSELRRIAENKAEKNLNSAMADKIYSEVNRELNDQYVKLAFAEIKNPAEAEKLRLEIKQNERKAVIRLTELGIDKDSLKPQYKCKICGDTGYDKNGNACTCLNEFLKTLK